MCVDGGREEVREEVREGGSEVRERGSKAVVE